MNYKTMTDELGELAIDFDKAFIRALTTYQEEDLNLENLKTLQEQVEEEFRSTIKGLKKAASMDFRKGFIQDLAFPKNRSMMKDSLKLICDRIGYDVDSDHLLSDFDSKPLFDLANNMEFLTTSDSDFSENMKYCVEHMGMSNYEAYSYVEGNLISENKHFKDQVLSATQLREHLEYYCRYEMRDSLHTLSLLHPKDKETLKSSQGGKPMVLHGIKTVGLNRLNALREDLVSNHFIHVDTTASAFRNILVGKPNHGDLLYWSDLPQRNKTKVNKTTLLYFFILLLQRNQKEGDTSLSTKGQISNLYKYISSYVNTHHENGINLIEITHLQNSKKELPISPDNEPYTKLRDLVNKHLKN